MASCTTYQTLGQTQAQDRRPRQATALTQPLDSGLDGSSTATAEPVDISKARQPGLNLPRRPGEPTTPHGCRLESRVLEREYTREYNFTQLRSRL